MSGLIILLELMSSFATIADLDETLNRSIETAMINVFWLPHDGVPAGCAVFRMKADIADQEVTCRAMQIFCLIRSM